MKSEFFIQNRQKLIEVTKGGLSVFTAHTGMQLHGDAAVPFRQEANFWYLTGIGYPDWRLVIDGKQGKSWLIAPDVDETHQLFDGSLSGEDAKKISGVDEVLSRGVGKKLLSDLAEKHQIVYTLELSSRENHAGFVLNPGPENLHKELTQSFAVVKDCRKELARLRAIKQPEEIEVMKKAATLSTEAFQRAKAKLPTCRYEYEVEAELGYHFRRHNATHAFEPIAASGKNACTLHYTDNFSELSRSQLLLIDAGARCGSYSADVTRTLSLGNPTKRQLAVHAAVRTAEQQIIALIKPGLSIKNYSVSTEEIMKEALLAVGLMKNKSDTAAYRRLFPHAISHGLGVDVHESLGGYKEFQAGMVLTVEPGIYIPEEGIGVRIEDDILVTETGHENLTAGLSTDL